MTTEYRRGIPSVAHVEAATRLGLLWQNENSPQTTIFEVRNGEILSDYGRRPSARNLDALLSHERSRAYRPIRTDGTPVDWEVLDAEVRVHTGRAGEATVTPTTSAAPTTQPQGFRADLWRRICENVRSTSMLSLSDVRDINTLGIEGRSAFHRDAEYRYLWQGMGTTAEAEPARQILTRWAVYQELKPLYDLVDGTAAVGHTEPLPIDVFQEWARDSRSERVAEMHSALRRDREWALSRMRLRLHNAYGGLQLHGPYCSWYLPSTGAVDNINPQEQKLANFAAVLDAVAEQRVAARQGQTAQPNTVTLSVGPSSPSIARGALLMQTPQGVRPATATPEPRSFADVRPDRHGWRWWWLVDAPGNTSINNSRFEVLGAQWRWLAMGGEGVAPSGTLVQSNDWTHLDIWSIRTVIPTDEQGNPVSWESIGQGRGQGAAQSISPTESQRIESVISEIIQRDLQQIDQFRVTIARPAKQPKQPAPLPRFTADELDDVDHSATTTQDSATLKRGKLPTVEAIGKYREVMSKRNGTVAEAVKASGIDCEVAQYVLERWSGGLSDDLCLWLLRAVGKYCRPGQQFTQRRIDELAQQELADRPALDTSEPVDTTAQRQRAEATERQARMAALQAQLAKERAGRVAEPIEEPSRFALLEVDEAADPTRSIEAWKTQRAALKKASTARPVTAPAPQPTPAPRRKAFEVVDAQAEGLSGGAVFAVLLSRAMNQNC